MAEPSTSTSEVPSEQSPEFQTKHMLQNEWTMWVDKRMNTNRRVRGEKDQYESNLKELGSFGTVEDFWRYYNNLLVPSKVENNANYHLFKKNIKPMWEDRANANGGKWTITLKDRAVLDRSWENLVLAMVGEMLDDQFDQICGAVMSRRKHGDRIAIWNKAKTNKEAIMILGRNLRLRLGIPEKVQLVYSAHSDALKSGASYSNPVKYTA